MNSFEGITAENVERCALEDISSGLQTRLYYAPASFFQNIILPTMGSFEEKMVISEGNIIFKNDLSWSFLDCLIDENEINTSISGAVGRKKQSCNFNIYILGLKAKILGFIEDHQNTPLVFMLPDANGNNWLVGHLRNRAKFEKADGNSGKKYEDNSGFNINISAKTSLYRYAGAIGKINNNTVEMPRRGGFYDITHL